MTEAERNAETRIRQYATSHDLELMNQLGAGYHGTVFSTNVNSAVKTFRYEQLYRRERDIDVRLFADELDEVCGCRIPTLIDYDDSLWIVEMEIVQPPFVLDFAGAYLDEQPK